MKNNTKSYFTIKFNFGTYSCVLLKKLDSGYLKIKTEQFFYRKHVLYSTIMLTRVEMYLQLTNITVNSVEMYG